MQRELSKQLNSYEKKSLQTLHCQYKDEIYSSAVQTIKTIT